MVVNESGQVWEMMWRVEVEGEVVQSPLQTHQVYWRRVVWEAVQSQLDLVLFPQCSNQQSSQQGRMRSL